MNEFLREKEDRDAIEEKLKSGDAFRFISGFEQSKAYESDVDGEKKKYIEFIGSSDQEDLVGDVMTVNALNEMVETAPGTVMLRDHNRSTDKIFGWILEAEMVKSGGVNLIKFKAEVDDEDTANVRIWKSIKKGFKIGASVTVVIKSKDKNPNSSNKKAMIIDSVKLLEISIVTIPCNQESWTLAATASKALSLAALAVKMASAENAEIVTPADQIPATDESAEINTKKEVEENMSDKTKIAGSGSEETTAPAVETENPAAAAETVADAAENPAEPAETVTETEQTTTGEDEAKQAPMPRTVAAMKAHADRRAAAETSKAAPEIVAVVTKGLFADEQARRQPTLWDLFDILSSVKWQLMDRKWAMEWAGEISGAPGDDYDYVGEYRTACAEFAEAAVKSFAYYGGFEVPVTDSESSVDATENITDEYLSNALDIQKSFEVFAELFAKSPDENKQKMLTIGEEFASLAKSAGIPLGTETAAKADGDNVSDEIVRKSQIFLDTETRADEAEKRAEEAESHLEVAKAGLATALEVIEKINRQPLHIGQR